MAGQRIDIMELKQLIRLKRDGYSNRKTADLLHVSRNTVNEYVRIFSAHGLTYEELMDLDDQSLHDLFPCITEVESHRFVTLSDQFTYFQRELKKPGCTIHTLWREYILKHPDGYMYSQFCYHFNQWRERVDCSIKLNHKAGEKLFIDFTGKKLSYVDKASGELIEVNVFVAILPSSGYTFVTATRTQSQEEVIEALNKCFHFIGGVPKVVVPDNMKAAVTKSHKYEPTINRSLMDFALHYGCLVDPTRPYSPKDKAMVEGAVKIVYQRMFYPLSKHTFFSLEDLNAAIEALLTIYNDYTLTNSSETRSQLFHSMEKEYLQELTQEPYEIRHFKKLKVQKMGHVFLSEDKHYYSVPYRYMGKQVEVQYSYGTVEIYYERERIALHRRSRSPGKYTTVAEHLSSSHKAYSEWSLEYFCFKAQKIGKYTEQCVRNLIQGKPYPEIAYKQAFGITMLTKIYPPERIENACKRTLDIDRCSYHTIANILKNGLENEQADQHLTPHIPIHGNIRGGNTYC